jgi:hypothetical protein
MENYIVGYVDEYDLTVMVETDLCSVLTAVSIARMTSLT